MKYKTKRWLYAMLLLLLGYLVFASVDTLNYKQQSEIAILGFHHVAFDDQKKEHWPNEIWTDSLSGFEEKMKYLYDNGYHTVSLDDVYEWRLHHKKLEEKSVVLTFDDGYDSIFALITPILEKYGFSGSAFVIGSLITEEDAAYDPAAKLPLSIADMKDQRTMTYYTHFYDMHYKVKNQAAVTMKSAKEIQEDLRKASQRVSVEFAAYPYGIYNNQTKDALKQCGVKLAFGFNENRKAKLTDDPYALPRFSVNSYTTIDLLQAMLESR